MTPLPLPTPTVVLVTESRVSPVLGKCLALSSSPALRGIFSGRPVVFFFFFSNVDI